MKECCRSYLNEQFGGDADVMNEIYGEYVSSLREKRSEAEAALAAGDWALLDRAAHTIKGNALAAGDQETAETAISLRNAAKLQDGGAASGLLAKIRELSAAL